LGKTFQNQNDALIMVYWVAQQVGSKPILMFKDLEMTIIHSNSKLTLQISICICIGVLYENYGTSNYTSCPQVPNIANQFVMGESDFQQKFSFDTLIGIILFVLFSRKAYNLHLE
jgi:hypothetical protein